MPGIQEIVSGLKREEARLEAQLTGVRNAISSLEGGVAVHEGPFPRVHKRAHGRPRTIAKAATAPRKRRRMSAAARKRISDAQKARWAKQKAGPKK